MGYFEGLLCFLTRLSNSILQYTDKATVVGRPEQWAVGLVAIGYIEALQKT